MKRLISMLFYNESGHSRWWHLRVSTGDPPEERTYMFELPQLIRIIRHRLTNVESKDETPIDP